MKKHQNIKFDVKNQLKSVFHGQLTRLRILLCCTVGSPERTCRQTQWDRMAPFPLPVKQSGAGNTRIA